MTDKERRPRKMPCMHLGRRKDALVAPREGTNQVWVCHNKDCSVRGDGDVRYAHVVRSGPGGSLMVNSCSVDYTMSPFLNVGPESSGQDDGSVVHQKIILCGIQGKQILLEDPSQVVGHRRWHCCDTGCSFYPLDGSNGPSVRLGTITRRPFIGQHGVVYCTGLRTTFPARSAESGSRRDEGGGPSLGAMSLD